MAIIFEEGKKINWFRIIVFILVLLAILGATYYLFFAPSPKIELFIPAPLEAVEKVAEFEFIDPRTITQSPEFRILRDYSVPATPGLLGRPNPFAPL